MHSPTLLPLGTEKKKKSYLAGSNTRSEADCLRPGLGKRRSEHYCWVLCSKRSGRKKKGWVWLALALACLHSKLSEAQSESKGERASAGERWALGGASFCPACRRDHVSNTPKPPGMQTPGKNPSRPAETGKKSLYTFKENVAFSFLFNYTNVVTAFAMIGF